MLTTKRIPWPGPQPYDELDWAVFFGRAEEIKKIKNRLTTQPLSILLGGSGSGKTSLIRAGLVPLLRNRRYNPTSRGDEGPVMVFRDWGATPRVTARELVERRLRDALKAIERWHGRYPNQERAREDVEILTATLDASTSSDVVSTLEALARAVQPANAVDSVTQTPLILVFDQLEELLRSKDRRTESDTGRVGEEMLEVIGELFVRGGPLRILISMREEYLYALRPLDRTVASMADMKILLDPVTTRDARRVVARVSTLPGVITVGDDVIDEILPESPNKADLPADLLRLQAVLYSLAAEARSANADTVNRRIFDQYLSRKRASDIRAQDVFQSSVEEWIDSAVRGEGAEDRSRTVASDAKKLGEEVARRTGLDETGLNAQVRRTAVRIAPFLASSDYKVPQEQGHLLRQALGAVLETLIPRNRLSSGSGRFTIAKNALGLDWSELELPAGDHYREALSGFARAEAKNVGEAADAIAACYLLTIERFVERNILRRTFSAKDEIVCELVHDQMGPMLAEWAKARAGEWDDCVSSPVALSGGTIKVNEDRVPAGTLRSLAWRGCAIEPQGKEVIFDGTRFEHCELKGIVFDRCVFRDVTFENCVLSGSIFRDCRFEHGETGRSLVVKDCGVNSLDGVLFLRGTITDIEFVNSVARQMSFVAVELMGDIVFSESCVAQLYAKELTGPSHAQIRIPKGSKAWCCTADAVSSDRIDAKWADFGLLTLPEPRHLLNKQGSSQLIGERPEFAQT